MAMDQKIEKKSKFRPGQVVGAVALVAVILFFYVSSSEREGSVLSVDESRLRTALAHRGTFNNYVSLRATVMPIDTIYLDSIQGGSVEEIYVTEGALVKKGQALAKLSNTQLQLDVISREAQVSEQLNFLRNTRLSMEENILRLEERTLELNYDLKQSIRDLRNIEDVVSKGGATETELAKAKDLVDYLRAKRDAVLSSLQEQKTIREQQLNQLQNSASYLEQNLSITRKNLDSLVIRSAIDGLLSSFSPKIGQSVSVGERVGQVDDIENYKLEALVDEFYIAQVSLGQKAKFSLEGKEHSSEVVKISPEVINGQFKIELHFEDKPDGLRRGQTIKLRQSLDEPSEAMLVDAGSYIQETGGNWVFVLDPQGKKATRRKIRTGRTNPDVVEVLTGLSEGEKIITSSYKEFKQFDQLIIE